MKPASAKAKGRRLQNEYAARVRHYLHLPETDVRVAVMGETGMDVKLSERARQVHPYAVEAKNVERLNIWDAQDQAEAHAAKTGLGPLVVYRRNGRPAWVSLPVEDFLDLLARYDEALQHLENLEQIAREQEHV